MPAAATQLNALVSSDTKRALDKYARKTGTKKAFVVEEAIRQHLSVLGELPPEFVVHSTLVVTPASMRRMVEAADAEPTQALRDLMRGR